MDTLAQDVRFALRTLRKNPGFTIIAVLALALGVGASAAIYSVIDGVLLRTLAYRDPARLVRIYEIFPNGYGSVAAANFDDWRAQSRSFSDLVLYSNGNENLQGAGEAVRLRTVTASANLFNALGVEPLRGRTFAAGDDEPGAPPVVILSEGFWRRRFAGDPAAVGQTITLDGRASTVIGVMPSRFRFPAGTDATDLWSPLALSPAERASRGSHLYGVIARLAPGATVESARRDLAGVARRLEKQYPDEQAGRSVRLVSLSDDVVGYVRPVLLVLFGAAVVVLLVACLNVANLLLARSTDRNRELAVRCALGAGRARLVRQMITESLVLAVGGAAIGALIAQWGVQAFVTLAGSTLPRSADVRFDGGVFAFLVAAAALMALGVGIAPALRASRADVKSTLNAGGSRAVARGGDRSRDALIVSEIALALLLVAGAGLLVRTFVHLRSADTGMRADNVLTFRVSVPAERYPDTAIATRFYAPALERIQALPGVSHAGAISALPLSQWGINGDFSIEGHPPAPASSPYRAEWRAVGGEYFTALGIPLLRGRNFTEADKPGSGFNVLVNQALVTNFFHDEDPIGQRLNLGDAVMLTIVGVVGSVRQAGLERGPLPEVYFSMRQIERTMIAPLMGEMSFVVAGKVPVNTLLPAIRGAIHSVDENQPLFAVRTMEGVISDSLADQRLYLGLLASFAGIALALAAAGIYGVMSYLVTQRTREIGIRMALGAEPGAVMRMVIGQGMGRVAIGVAAGLAAAFASTRVLAGLLHGVTPTDPGTLAAVVAILAGIAMLAIYIPARRAMRVDPNISLRTE